MCYYAYKAANFCVFTQPNTTVSQISQDCYNRITEIKITHKYQVNHETHIIHTMQPMQPVEAKAYPRP